jgi:methylthioribulose-1-phosphate dehydratase
VSVDREAVSVDRDAAIAGGRAAGVDRDTAVAAGGRLAAEARRLSALGWMRATSGNLSEVLATAPLRLAVTASGLDKGELRAESVVVVDADGEPVPVEGLAPLKPSDEAALHARIAAATGAGAVVHVHPLAAVVAGRRSPEGVRLRGLEMLKALGRSADDDEVLVPVLANSQDMHELADRFDADHDPRTPGVVVADHGLYVWGRDLVQARHRTESLEWLLEFHLETA